MPVAPVTGAINPAEFSIGGPVKTGSEWSVGTLKEGTPVPNGDGADFGGVLTNQLEKLTKTQNMAAEAARSLATGTAPDPAAAVVAVDRARLAMQLAATIRTKGVEAAQDLLRTQI